MTVLRDMESGFAKTITKEAEEYRTHGEWYKAAWPILNKIDELEAA